MFWQNSLAFALLHLILPRPDLLLLQCTESSKKPRSFSISRGTEATPAASPSDTSVCCPGGHTSAAAARSYKAHAWSQERARRKLSRGRDLKARSELLRLTCKATRGDGKRTRPRSCRQASTCSAPAASLASAPRSARSAQLQRGMK